MEKKGLSVMVAVFLLLAISMALSGVLGLILARFRPGEFLNASLELQRGVDRKGRDELTLIHRGGELINNAFKLKSGGIEWIDLEVRIEGKPVAVNGATLNGEDNVGIVDFSPDNVLVFPLEEPLATGDWVAVIYNPKNQILLQTVV